MNKQAYQVVYETEGMSDHAYQSDIVFPVIFKQHTPTV